MEEILYYIAYILETVFETYVIARLMGMFLEYTPEKKKYILGAWVLRVILGTLQYVWIPYPSLNLMINLGTMFFIVVWYNGNLLKKLMVVFLIAICQFAAELMTTIFFMIGNSGLRLSRSGRNGDALSFVVIAVILWIISEIICSFQSIHNDITVPRIFSGCIILLSIIVILLEIMIFTENIQSNSVKILSVIYMLLVLFLIVYLYDILSKNYMERLQAELIEREKNYYYQQAELLQSSSRELSAFRHDSMNYLYALQSMLSKSDEAAKQYMEKLIGKMQDVDEYSDTGNIAVDSVINYKLAIAEQKQIEVTSNVIFPEHMDYAEEDLITVLGNLLDNAIEATEKVEENRYIKFEMKYKFGALFISVKNCYDGKLVMKKGELTTRKQNSKYHGIGLMSIKKVVGYHGGNMDIKYDKKDFEVNIMMYI